MSNDNTHEEGTILRLDGFSGSAAQGNLILRNIKYNEKESSL